MSVSAGRPTYARVMSNTCMKCQSSKTTSAVVQNASLEPKSGGMMIQAAAKVELRAQACLDCGHVELTADPARLKVLAAAG